MASLLLSERFPTIYWETSRISPLPTAWLKSCTQRLRRKMRASRRQKWTKHLQTSWQTKIRILTKWWQANSNETWLFATFSATSSSIFGRQRLSRLFAAAVAVANPQEALGCTRKPTRNWVRSLMSCESSICWGRKSTWVRFTSKRTSSCSSSSFRSTRCKSKLSKIWTARIGIL